MKEAKKSVPSNLMLVKDSQATPKQEKTDRALGPDTRSQPLVLGTMTPGSLLKEAEAATRKSCNKI